MKVMLGIGRVRRKFKNPVLAIGVFDGLHLGHQELIKKMTAKARSLKGTAVVVTFSPHPVHVLHPEIKLPLIISLSFRLKLMEALGVDVCIVIHFTKQFARLSPDDFIRKYLVEVIGVKEVFVGDDFRFGQNRIGTLELFQESGKVYGFKVNAIHPVHPLTGGQDKISSTHIRQFITDGRLSEARHLLGRPVTLTGKVVRGDSRGKKLGFPTANIYPGNEIIPPLGVYAVYVIVSDKRYQGMANIGYRPTFKSNNKQVNVEVHLFGFNKNLYGKEIVLEFLHKIRDEKIFPAQQHLIAQLKKDKLSAQKIFASVCNLH